MQFTKSIDAFKRAQRIIPGGVNSPVRAFKSVSLNPVFIKQAKGSVITDIDGNQYIDYLSSWGPLIFGHAHEAIISAINKAAQKGTSYGAPTEYETEMAELIVEMVPSIEKVRMVNSGTEATMSAIRLARGFTKRDGIVKFAGNYHGHGDSFLIHAGSGAITLGLPDSPGVTVGTAKDTFIAEYNNLDSVRAIFREKGSDIAAVIVEPVAGNMGVVLPSNNFLVGLRVITREYGSLLIFDEVITGFRLAKGSAQEYYNVMPDLTTLGKIIGGGLPVGAYGGRKDIMEMLAPAGPVYQAGTLSGNPLAMAAGIAMLKLIKETPDFHSELERKAAKLEKGFHDNLSKAGVKAVINRVGSMMTMFFTNAQKVTSLAEAMTSDTAKYAAYFKRSLESGIYIAPSQFECLFVSYAHSNSDIEKTIEASLKAMKKRIKELIMAESIFIETLKGRKTERPPVWFMRQAGRVLPTYLELRKQHSFSELMNSPKLAAEVTLLPVYDLGVDAAILFSDILVIPVALGMHLEFTDSGPKFDKPLKEVKHPIGYLLPDASKLEHIYKTIDVIQNTKPASTPLIGFCGAPFTTFCYMVEGMSSNHNFPDAVALLYKDKVLANKLLSLITELSVEYALNQVKHGVSAFQIFETHAGLIPSDFYFEMIMPYVRRISSAVMHAGCPVIFLPKGLGTGIAHIKPTDTNFLSIDWQTPIEEARKMVHPEIGLQGNLDPRLLLADKVAILEKLEKYIEFGSRNQNWIFNLGHGFIAGIPFENARLVVDWIKKTNWRRE